MSFWYEVTRYAPPFYCVNMYVQVIEWPTVKNPANSLFLHLSLIKITGVGGGDGISTDHLEITRLMGRDARLDTLSVDYYVEIAWLIDVP